MDDPSIHILSVPQLILIFNPFSLICCFKFYIFHMRVSCQNISLERIVFLKCETLKVSTLRPLAIEIDISIIAIQNEDYQSAISPILISYVRNYFSLHTFPMYLLTFNTRSSFLRGLKEEDPT